MWNGHQEVAPHVAHQILHVPLRMSSSGPTEVAFEQIVGAEGNELPLFLPSRARQHPLHRQREVVIGDRPGHGAHLLEGSDMASEKGLLALPEKGHDEGPVKAAHVQTEELDPGRTAVQVDPGFTPVCLGLAGVVLKGNCHFSLPRPALPYVLADGGLAALEAEFRDQPLVDAAGRVALLWRPLLVFL